MKKTYIFTPRNWDKNEFFFVRTAREDYYRPMLQMDDHISNSYDNDRPGYDFISMLSKEPVSVGTVCETTCEFSGTAAPLIVFTDDILTLENGDLQYGEHFEVVIYKNGCNVWDIPLVDGKAVSRNLIRCKFPVEENKKVVIRVEFLENLIKITADGTPVEVPCDHFPKGKFYVGITACEGICKFYDFTVDAK